MKATCKNCIHYKSCKKDKTKLCELFIFNTDQTKGTIVVKTSRIKKG